MSRISLVVNTWRLIDAQLHIDIMLSRKLGRSASEGGALIEIGFATLAGLSALHVKMSQPWANSLIDKAHNMLATD